VIGTVTVARSRAELAVARDELPGRVAVVMTMGALHDGHAELVRRARELADGVLVTIFVNPLQFGTGEDLDRYPRTFDADVELCTAAGATVVFAPTPDVVYPEPALVRVSPGPLGDQLEGAVRPGHFEGVLTVVAKLLHLTRPDVAVFGDKDAQQLALIRLMVRDLDFPVQVVGVPTVRERDGLAMSSRNVYLTAAEREHALALSRALDAGAAAGASGPAAVLSVAGGMLRSAPGVELDYLALRSDPELGEINGDQVGSARLLVAARVGTTRLIDNVPVVLGTPPGLKE
jgi:pantoate--beta-alanine ligase